MNKIAKELNSKFVVGLGDNFYVDGVTDINDKRFKESFEDVYDGDSIQTKWYMVAGNHGM
jgi:tartrate-resistant acid phosphatase type 5